LPTFLHLYPDIRYVTYFRVTAETLVQAKVKKNGYERYFPSLFASSYLHSYSFIYLFIFSLTKIWKDWKGMDNLAKERDIDDFYEFTKPQTM
jgi:hypothetical protein